MKTRLLVLALAVSMLPGCATVSSFFRSGPGKVIYQLTKEAACAMAQGQVTKAVEELPDPLKNTTPAIAARVCEGAFQLAYDSTKPDCPFQTLADPATMPESAINEETGEEVGEKGFNLQWVCFDSSYDACAVTLGDDRCSTL